MKCKPFLLTYAKQLQTNMNNHDTLNEVISEQSNVVLLRAKGNNGIYATTDGERYENLTQGVCGRIEPEEAGRLFAIPLELNLLAQRNENLIKLITLLKLAVEK